MTISEQILPQFMLRIYEFLATPIIKTWFCSMEIWTITHFGLGFLVFYLVRKEKYPLLIVFGLLFLYEIFEFIFSYIIPLMLKETIQDIIWDLIIGMLGAGIMCLILKSKKK